MSSLSSFVLHALGLSITSRSEDAASCTGGCIAGWKAGFAAILLAEGLFFGHAVLLLKHLTDAGPAFRVAVHFGHALSAGVFFATGMLHVLPEAIELLSAEEDIHVERIEDVDAHDHGEATFPWAFLILMLSFYFVFFVEQILLPRLAPRRSAETHDVEQPALALEKEKKALVAEDSVSESTSSTDLGPAGFRSNEFATGLVEILGLSAHSLFESMALGLSREFGTMLNIFIATAAHRWATALALAFTIARRLAYLPFLTLLFLFSAMVPLGIGVGAALTELSDTAQGVLFAVSAGTFVYIGVFESMAEEYVEHDKWLMRKFAATLAGAAIIVVTTVLLVRFDVHG